MESRVHEPEVHGLLCVVDGGHFGYDAQPHQEEPDEQDLGRQEHRPVLPREILDLCQVPPVEENAWGRRHKKH